jgi:hypothetical protein
MWNWVVIIGGYLFAALFLRLLGGFNSAGAALANWGRRSAANKMAKSGESPASYARSRLGR